MSSGEKARAPGGLMDAVSALASLGGPEDEQQHGDLHLDGPVQLFDGDSPGKSSKRYIPDHKKPDAALTFPEKLMNMIKYADEFRDDESYCVGWLPDGKSFVVRNPDAFTRQVLPKFFKATKFQSFTRKLYRWGFRQVNRGIGPDDPIIFGNAFFQRDNEELMVRMRSVTSANNRKKKFDDLSGHKRSLEELDEQRKAILLDRLMQEKAAMGMAPPGGGDPNAPQMSGQVPGGYPSFGQFPPGFAGRPSALGAFPGMMRNFAGGYPPMQMSPQQQQQAFNMMMQQASQQQQGGQPPNMLPPGVVPPNMAPPAPSAAQPQQAPQPLQQQAQPDSTAAPQNAPQQGNGDQPSNEQDIMNAAINALRGEV